MNAPTKEQLSADDIKEGRVYAAKRPRKVGEFFRPVWNDRQVCWISKDRSRVQYDSPAVRNGGKFPAVSMDEFLAFVGSDVTDKMPEGDWRTE